MSIQRFNIRVYFILFSDDRREVLLSDELILGQHTTKFPGGGLEYGEGIIDCAKREAMEELGQAIEIVQHLYTTEFFQQSAFRQEDQIVSVYYEARLAEQQQFKVAQKPFDFSESNQSFRWVLLDEVDEADLSFPIDKTVLGLLRKLN